MEEIKDAVGNIIAKCGVYLVNEIIKDVAIKEKLELAAKRVIQGSMQHTLPCEPVFCDYCDEQMTYEEQFVNQGVCNECVNYVEPIGIKELLIEYIYE